MGALALLLFAAVLASNVLVFQAQIVLTAGVFVSIVVAFLALYWAYFEFEWLYRTYWWLWRTSIEAAAEGYNEHYPKERGNAQKAKTRENAG